MPLFRLIVHAGGKIPYDRILVEAPSDEVMVTLIANVSDEGYRLIELISTLIPTVKTISYNLTPVAVPGPEDSVFRWDLVDPEKDSAAGDA